MGESLSKHLQAGMKCGTSWNGNESIRENDCPENEPAFVEMFINDINNNNNTNNHGGSNESKLVEDKR